MIELSNAALIGQVLAEARAVTGRTQMDVATAAGFRPEQLSKWERSVTTPDLHSVILILAECGLRLTAVPPP